MTTLTFIVDDKVVVDIKTYISGHQSTVCCLTLGRKFPYGNVVRNEQPRISSEAFDTGPCWSEEPD